MTASVSAESAAAFSQPNEMITSKIVVDLPEPNAPRQCHTAPQTERKIRHTFYAQAMCVRVV